MEDIELLRGIGQKIKLFRSQKSLNQGSLAKRCGFDKASLSRIESGRTNVSVLTLHKISDSLGVQIHELLK